MPRKKLDFDAVREIALALPGVEEGSMHGARSWKVSGRLLACPAVHQSAEPNSLAVCIGLDQRAALLAAEPSVYYVTDHYLNFPIVLVRLGQINRASIKDLLSRAWRFVKTKKP